MIVIMGGGLSGSLLAYQMSLLSPTPEFTLIESRNNLSDHHTWSFHHSDLQESSYEWIRPLISQSWHSQTVHFPSFSRTLKLAYHSIRSHEFRTKITKALQNRLILGDPVCEVSSEGCVQLASGKKIQADLIFDARGIKSNQHQASGYQNFFGMDLELTQPHGLDVPIIMDTRCAQSEGFKFFYLLPWTSHSLLVEATCYSNTPEFDPHQYKREIEEYCSNQNWTIQRIRRTEQAALPIPLNCTQRPPQLSPRIIPIGMLGGYFHYTTGYSFPLSVRVSETITHTLRQSNWSIQKIQSALAPLSAHTQQQALFFSTLNRMLFLACRPENRIQVFSRFYGLNQNLITRFYQGNLKWRDQLRILMGKPPVPLLAGLKHALDSKTTQCSWERSPT